MSRSLFVTIHMYLSAFFAPVIFLVAISGGFYLIGIKGSVEQTTVFETSDPVIDKSAGDLKAQVDALAHADVP